MPRYDYTSLSPQDFEDLVRDALQAEWNVALEAFTAGRDGGVDLRYATTKGSSIVIQCKHYAGAGFNKLLAHLRDVERPKLARLRPDRYLVATSVGLTPANKAAIIEALQPFVLGTQDVIGRNDLDGLLARHPDVERTNFKLWLSSAAVLEHVLHNAELCHTEFEISRIRRKLPLFVQSDAFTRAKEILEDGRVVIVSGVPGIGKTTLAEMLLYAYLSEGYEPVVIQAEIAEGRKFFKRDAKKIFYFDDFLGQTFLGDRPDYLGRNQDAALIDFIEMIRRSSHARFILTTREHLLSSAIQASERLAHGGVLDHRCVLDLRDYSRRHRARILYNHLFFSDLPHAFKTAVLEDDFFLKVINHEHFNPRLIEWLTSYPRLRQVEPAGYRAHVQALLDSPEAIWDHAYRTQLSPGARNVLLALYTLGSWATEIVDLEPAFSSLHRHSAARFRHSTAAGDFRRALQELDGAFLSYGPGGASFLNPSVRDFLAATIARERELVEGLVESAVRFRQITELKKLSDTRSSDAISAVFTSDDTLVYAALSRVARGPSTRWEKSPTGYRGYPIDAGEENRILFLIEMAELHRSARYSALATKLSQELIDGWTRRLPDFSSVIRLLGELREKSWFMEQGGRDLHRQLLNELLTHLNYAFAQDWLSLLTLPEAVPDWTPADESAIKEALTTYLDDGIDDERWNCTTVDELTGLRNALSELETKFGLDIGRNVERLDETIAEREDDAETPEREAPHPIPTSRQRDLPITDDGIRDLFGTLLDEGSEDAAED